MNSRCLFRGVVPLRTAPRPAMRRLRAVDSARSDLVLQETALFLYQLQYDSRMQQAMLFDAFDLAQKFKAQRDEVDSILEKFQTDKGPQSGAAPLSNELMEITTTGLSLRNELNKAVEEERYDEAARIRDEISRLSERAEMSSVSAGASPDSVEFKLGNIVKHKSLDYRGVVCGWDLGCCESAEWKKAAAVSALKEGTNQPFYHVLVDERDWPAYTRGPPVAYVAQESLELVEGMSPGDFNQILHPFLLTMFLGTDNSGSYIPCSQLRNKYKMDREDSYPPEDQE